MRPLIVCHADCLDGFAAAYVAWLSAEGDSDFIFARYNNQDDIEKIQASANKQRRLFILDFSFPLEMLTKFEESFCQVVMLDHHKTAFEMFGIPNHDRFMECTSKHYYLLDNSKSGCILAWEFLFNEQPVPLALQHIDDRDRWQFNLQGTKEYCAALWNYPRLFDTWNWAFSPEGIKQLYQEGEALLRDQYAHVKRCEDRAREITLTTSGQNYYGLVANTDQHTSEVGHALAHASGTYGLIWYIDATGMVNCSLRSNGDYDVSAIAKQFGGGGHKNAAGFKCPVSELTKLLS